MRFQYINVSTVELLMTVKHALISETRMISRNVADIQRVII